MRRKKRSPADNRQAAAHAKSHGSPPGEKIIKYDPDEVVPGQPELTLREEEVCFWVVRGKENDEVARILGANAGTIRKHVENIRYKFKVESRLAVLASYWEREVDRRDRIIAKLRRQLEERD